MEPINIDETEGIDLRDEELQKVEPRLNNIISKINEAWDTAKEHFTLFTKKRDKLIEECNAYREEFRAEVRKIREKRDLKVACINSANDLIGKGVENVLEGQTLSVHDSLCRRLQDLLASAKREDSERAKEIARRVACLTFTPYMFDAKHILGELSLKQQWRLEKEKELALTGLWASSFAATRDGKMVVGYARLFGGGGDGVQVCSVNGSQVRKLQGVWVQGVAVLRDGRFVLRDCDGCISLYSQTWGSINAAVIKAVDEYGGMDVDGSDHIYVGCRNAEVVRVFTPLGGPPVREIPCPGYTPYTVCTMNHSEMLVLSDDSSVRVVDREGKVMCDVSNKGFSARVAVLQDDNILIGWGKAGRMNVDLYTNQLKLVRRVLANYPINGSMRAIREFSTGEIALCTQSKLHIFRKTQVSLTDVTTQ